MTTKNISRNKGCRLLVIEPVHCGPSSIRLLTFFGTPCTCICFVRRGGSSICSIWVYLFTFVIAAAVRQFSADAAAATTAVSRPPPRFCNKLCFLIFVLIYTTTIDNDDTNAKTETFERQIQLQCEIISTRTLLWLQNSTVNTMDWEEFRSSTLGQIYQFR